MGASSSEVGGTLDDVVGGLVRFLVALGDDRDDDALASLHFLDVGEGLFVEHTALGAGGIAGRQDDYREVLVD